MAIGVNDINPLNSLSSAQKFTNSVRDSVFSIMSAIDVNRFDKSFTQSGVKYNLGNDITTGATINVNPDSNTGFFGGLYPRSYNIANMTPSANVIVKKRLFSTLAYDNDIRFLDSYERAFLRASKSLFQMKAFQIATYEALTKFEQILQEDHTLYIPAVLTAIQNAHAFGAFTDDEVSKMESVLLQITQRDLDGQDSNFTTWFIDQFDQDLADVGRGVGVIEFTNFTSINTSNKLESDGSASVKFEDPYHIMMISNDDIEQAINGSIFDNFTSILLPSLGLSDVRTLSEKLQNQSNGTDPVLNAQATAAINTVKQTAFDVVNQQPPSPAMIDFVRKKMRKFYLGKAVIQPTDGIHIFMKSNTLYEDDEDPVGLPIGLDRFGVDEEILKQEMYFVTKDKDFDINLYKTLRDKNAFSGASVFAGVVESVTDEYESEGFYALSVSAKNNLWYLEQSFINTQPALDQKQGYLYDPLTPFEYNFDNFGNVKTTGTDGVGFILNQDNINRLSQVNIKYETGKMRGMKATKDNIVSGIVPGTNVQQAEHFPGMVYRWKEGIAAFPLVTTTSDTTGLFYNLSPEAVNNAYGLPVVSSIFDNMDVANIVSILVTGKPYNISTFINDSIKASTLYTFLNNSSSSATSYFGNSFFDVISRQNKVLGNFQPLLNGDSVSIEDLKKLVYQQVGYGQVDTRIGQLEDQIFSIQQKLDNMPVSLNSSDSELIEKTRQGLQAEIDALRQEEGQLIQQITQISTDIQKISNQQDALNFSTDPEQREQQLLDFKFKQLYLSNKRIEDVRYNRDNNYFIVGTEYDTDLDIQAYITEMRHGFKYIENRYDRVFSKIKEAANMIGFEFFADNSGNVRFRVPQYNKIPLSVYYQLFRIEGQRGINILPDFVKNMFVDNITSIRENIVQINWQMLIELGKSGDSTLINALDASANGTTTGILQFLGFNPDNQAVSDGNTTNELIEFNSVDQVQINKKAPILPNNSNLNTLTVDNLNYIATQMEKRFGGTRNVITEDDIVSTSDSAALTKRKELFKNLHSLSSARNSAIKSYLSQLNNMNIDVNDINNSASPQDVENQFDQLVSEAVQEKQQKLSQEILQSVMMGSVQGYSKPNISSEFSNLVEDDTRNMIGRGSGRRFIIRDDSIISYSVTETKPDYCHVTVTGQQNFGESFFNSSMDGRILSAAATDFTSWRQYGFSQSKDIKAPFLHDADTQCKPYAVYLLIQQQSKTLKANLTISGNEYYQLGDVIYLADKDLLFYVTGVDQSYTEGANYTTNLSLEYGRPPGVYIPTPLDAIGKTLLKQHNSSLSVTNRSLNSDTFYYPLRPTPVLFIPTVDILDGDLTEQMLSYDSNQGRLVNALMNANIALERNNAYLLISGFSTSPDGYTDVVSRVNLVANWFSNPKVFKKGINGNVLSDLKEFNRIPPIKIKTTVLDLSASATDYLNQPNFTNQNDIISSDQSVILPSNPSELLGILNPCQECYGLIDQNNLNNDLPFVIEIGIVYKKE